jgi:hypothetical protein
MTSVAEMAERVGFEPTKQGHCLLALQASALDQLSHLSTETYKKRRQSRQHYIWSCANQYIIMPRSSQRNGRDRPAVLRTRAPITPVHFTLRGVGKGARSLLDTYGLPVSLSEPRIDHKRSDQLIQSHSHPSTEQPQM